MAELINWNDIRNEFESTTATLQELADKYNISAGTLRCRKSREKWEKKSSDDRNVSSRNATKQRNVATNSKGATQQKNVATDKKATQREKKDNGVRPSRTKEPRKGTEPSRVEHQITEYSEKLTEKERLFCFNYVNVHQFNATRSYYDAFGCSYESARRQGSLLLTNLDVRAEIARLKEIKYQSIMLKAEDLVEKHMRIAFSTITDFVTFGQVEKVVGKIKKKVYNIKTEQEEEIEFPLTAMVNDVRFMESTEVDGAIIQEVKVGRDGASIKLYDAQKSMDWLERYFQWNPLDKHKKQFDQEKLRIEREKLEIQREAVKKESGNTPEQGVTIRDDLNE